MKFNNFFFNIKFRYFYIIFILTFYIYKEVNCSNLLLDLYKLGSNLINKSENIPRIDKNKSVLSSSKSNMNINLNDKNKVDNFDKNRFKSMNEISTKELMGLNLNNLNFNDSPILYQNWAKFFHYTENEKPTMFFTNDSNQLNQNKNKNQDSIKESDKKL